MATFATCPDLHRHPSTRHAGLAAISFCAKDNVNDELHGVPPATSYISGQSQFLKSLSHPSLCEYLDVVKGKRDRLFVVSEHHNNSLEQLRNSGSDEKNGETVKRQEVATIRKWAAEILDGLAYLNAHGVVHRTLSLSNVLLNMDGHIKLSNYGLYNMTKGGALVEFSIGDPHYLSPNTLGQQSSLFDFSVDIWSVGVLLAEMLLGESFWRKDCLDLEELIGALFLIRRLSVKNQDWIQTCPETVGINPVVLHFLRTGAIKSGTDSDDEITIDTTEPQEAAKFLRDCLNLGSTGSNDDTREAAQLRNHSFLKQVEQIGHHHLSFSEQRSKLWSEKPYIQSSTLPEYEGEAERLRMSLANGKSSSGDQQEQQPKLGLLSKLPLSQVYYLWKLAGGDVESQFRRDGRLAGTPSIQLLPKLVQVAEGREERPSARDIADLFSDVSSSLPLENLEAEIIRSIREPNKDQFAWDTDYFLLSDPDEMNFLQSTMNDDHQANEPQQDSFLYPDSIQSNTTTAMAALGGSGSTAFKYLSSIGSTNGYGGLLSNSSVQSLTQQPTRIRAKVPLSIREKDLGYQYHRLAMFTELLLQYPASRSEILHHSKIDIPPLLRGKVWAAILGVVGDYQEVYEGFDKYTEKSTDRQIELDVPRCHQYNQLMFSPQGHEKMKRLLKCWVEANDHQVYWQGLDSCCAPFLTLNFNDEALAFSCVQLFLPKFLKDMFLHDNSQVIHEYLAVFRHLLSFHDPELSSHLDHIRFIPQLYAISWFMTLFTHIFPLDKIYHLWDKILVGPSSLPLFVGIAILQQFRQELLRSEFNEAIGIFSESFPGMDIEKCIESALAMCRVTPPSTCWLSYDQESREMRHQFSMSNGFSSTSKAENSSGDQNGAGPRNSLDLEKRHSGGMGIVGQISQGGGSVTHWWEEPLTIETMNAELAPRIHRSDFVRLRQQAMVIDIRPDAEFRNGHYPLSIHMMASQLDFLLHILKKLKKNYLVVIANRGYSGPEFASNLVRAGFTRVALLMGGIDALRISESQTIANTPSSPSLTSTSTSSSPSTNTTSSTICSCRVIRQVITPVHNKVKEEISVQKCKTPFTIQKKIRSTLHA
ncbi:hypothetical protein BGZ83_011126 [Gryganskiella cystojenkinii]|nr:hypothetical protein BGZ83_011126 [Gryganskiella cystojenkinii]